jgi:hypothetical protein
MRSVRLTTAHQDGVELKRMVLPSRSARYGLVLLACGCATAPHRGRERETVRCDFVVYNRTPHALEIRMRARRLSTTEIGTLNPGELLTYSVPCAMQRVWIGGIPIPSQVGAPVSFRFVQGEATLIEGERVEIALQWP